jgi:hypothetical protein
LSVWIRNVTVAIGNDRGDHLDQLLLLIERRLRITLDWTPRHSFETSADRALEHLQTLAIERSLGLDLID